MLRKILPWSPSSAGLSRRSASLSMRLLLGLVRADQQAEFGRPPRDLFEAGGRRLAHGEAAVFLGLVQRGVGCERIALAQRASRLQPHQMVAVGDRDQGFFEQFA